MPYAPEGNIRDCQIVFIGEAPARWEMRKGRPLVGPSGVVFDEQLQGAGISRKRCYLTNVFDFQITKNKQGAIFDQNGYELWHPRKGFSEGGRAYVQALQEELKDTNANVIVPMGNVALDAICSKRAIMSWRGSILQSTPGIMPVKKCVPTIHPANALYGQYTNRYTIRGDFKRAKRESAFPNIVPLPYRFELNPTFDRAIGHLKEFISTKKPLSVDVEVAKRQVSRCCFAWSDWDAISIPYGDGNWTLEQEVLLWKTTAELLQDPNITKVFQNGIFDCWMFFHIHNILVAPQIEDTMIAHHIIYPDFPKSLAFLTSLYTDQPFYKNMVRHGDVDKSDG